MRGSTEWRKKSMRRSERNDDDVGGNNMKKTTEIVSGEGKTDEQNNGMSVAVEVGLGNLCKVE